jgi:type IV secretory pathway VirB2 component (pilin)
VATVIIIIIIIIYGILARFGPLPWFNLKVGGAWGQYICIKITLM